MHFIGTLSTVADPLTPRSRSPRISFRCSAAPKTSKPDPVVHRPCDPAHLPDRALSAGMTRRDGRSSPPSMPPNAQSALDIKVIRRLPPRPARPDRQGQAGGKPPDVPGHGRPPPTPDRIYGVPVKGPRTARRAAPQGLHLRRHLLYSGASLNDIYLHQQERYHFDRYHQIHSPALTRSMVNYVDDVFLGSEAVQRLDRTGIPGAKQLKGQIRRFKRACAPASTASSILPTPGRSP